jgi:hypothetical protein
VDELVAELRRLATRFPLPHPIWHAYTDDMHAVLRDLLAALDAIAFVPSVQIELARLIETQGEPPPPDAGGPIVAAARKRLRDLPVPQGEHPYLDEIVPTLEAAAAALAALTVPDGEQAFARQIGEAPSDQVSPMAQPS